MHGFGIAAAIMAATVSLAVFAQGAGLDNPNRKELKRVDLSGAQGMEVINSITEYQPGDEIKRHIHHGVESAYVVQGAMTQVPGKEPTPLPTGASLVNLREVAHGGFKVVGDIPLILFTVHIVDKGKPLYDAPM
jgi:quercetin dioxygenase-like cupin family protein